MVTKIYTTPIVESVLQDPSIYSEDYGCYQIDLDCVQEHSAIMESLIAQEFEELSCVDESKLITLRENAVGDFFKKLAEMVGRFVERFQLAMARFFAKLKNAIVTVVKLKKLTGLDMKYAFGQNNGNGKSIEVITLDDGQIHASVVNEFDRIGNAIDIAVNSLEEGLSDQIKDDIAVEKITQIKFGSKEKSDKSFAEYLSEEYTRKNTVELNSSGYREIVKAIETTTTCIDKSEVNIKKITKSLKDIQGKLAKKKPSDNIKNTELAADKKLISASITSLLQEINRYFTQLLVLSSKVLRDIIRVTTSNFQESALTETVDGEGWDTEEKKPEGWSNPAETDDNEPVEEEVNMSSQYESDMEDLFWSEPFLENDSDFGDNGEFIENPPSEAPELDVDHDKENDQYNEDPAKDDGADDFMKDSSDEQLTIESQFII